jgi:hypothetical protein
MCISLTIEMSFLGLSTSAALMSSVDVIKGSTQEVHKLPLGVGLLICAILPLFILLGGVLGSTLLANGRLPLLCVYCAAAAAAAVADVASSSCASSSHTATTWTN